MSSETLHWVSRPLGGQIWCKRSRWFQHQYLIKNERMDFEGQHSCSCCRQKVAVSYLGGLHVLPGVYGFSAASHCRWPSVELVMQRSTLSSHIKKVLAPVLKLGLHVLQVLRLSCLNSSRNFSFTLFQTTGDSFQLQVCLEEYSWPTDASVCMCWL